MKLELKMGGLFRICFRRLGCDYLKKKYIFQKEKKYISLLKLRMMVFVAQLFMRIEQKDFDFVIWVKIYNSIQLF